ncbi:MAG: hypothetical protein E6J20_08015 [Chloroflexi bacterium]|nr:MAG: hypothetical protein E6J20_08015 [Chloroflexota bacterium]
MIRAFWRRLDSHLQWVPIGVPQMYGALIALLITAILIRLDPRDFGITWTTFWTFFIIFVGGNGLLVIGSVIYRLSNSRSSD